MEVAAQVEVDVCSYRLIPGQSHVSIAALSRALTGFQTLFSLVYDAIKTGPKRSARLSTQVRNDTNFGYAYSFSGSVGFIMTLPNEQLLLGETHLDEALRNIFLMAKSTSPQEIADFAKKLGAPPVRAMYSWANDHVGGGLGADIEWQRRGQVRSTLFVQEPQLEQLRDVIAETSDETEEDLEVIGDLVGANVSRKTFHMETTGGGKIQGIFADAISEEHAVVLPKPYSAKIRKTTKIVYSIEEEQVSYFLLSLRPIL